MPLQLRWQPGGVALLLKLDSGETAEERILAEEKFDFELTPLFLTSEDGRRRFSSILANLQARGGEEKNEVDLLIPASWGHTLKLRDPLLRDAELEEHLLWELSKNLLESAIQYQYNYLRQEDGGIYVAVIRRRLLDAIRRTMHEAGFTLRGVYFQEAPFTAIDLTRSPSPPTAPSRRSAVETEPIGERKPRRTRGAEQPAWFLPALLIAAAVVLIGFFWWRSTRERPAAPLRLPQPETMPVEQPQETTMPPTQQAEEPPAPAEETPVSPTQPSTAKAWTGMNGRIALLQEILSKAVDRRKFDLLSFTADYFLLEISVQDSAEMESVFGKVEQLPGITIGSKQSVVTLRGSRIGTLCGKIEAEPAPPAPGLPNLEQISELAGKHNLMRKGMIFTGEYEPIIRFAADCAALDFAVYRMIMVPWKDQQFRIVFEP